jgi:Leucine-rich repeat (LRR) protein
MLNVVESRVCAIVLLAGILIIPSLSATRGGTRMRVLHFPRDHSLGIVSTGDWTVLETRDDVRWQALGEAVGEVSVPAGKAVRLDLSRENKDLLPLAALEPNDLQVLCCESVELGDDELRHLAHLTGLREIDLAGATIHGTGLKHFAGLRRLKRLWLNGTQVGDNELACLLDLPSLRELGLSRTPTGDAGTVHVGKMTSLELLDLSAGVGDEGLGRLRSLINLRWLSAGNSGVTNEGLAHLEGMTRLEYLNLNNAQISDVGLVHLKQMAELKTLCLLGTGISEMGFAHLTDLRELETIQVLFGVSDVGLAALAKLPSLKNVEIDGKSISEKGLALLATMASLEELYIDNTDRMDAILAGLPKLPRIKTLTLGTGLTDEGLLRLRDMPSLCDLTIGPTAITAKGLDALAQLPSLKRLTVYQLNLASVDDWAVLGRLSSLEELSLKYVRSPVTDACVTHLAGLQSLKELRLDAIVMVRPGESASRTDITDEGLSQIAGFKKLETLSLSGARITDEGLRQLAGLSSLTWLDVQCTPVTEEGLRRLQKKLPALRWRP